MIDHEFDRSGRWACVPLAVYQDRRLSGIDHCVLGYLLSRTPNWIVSPSDVARVLGIDRRSAERSLDRLEEFGYSEPKLKVTAKRTRRVDSRISAVSKNPYVAPKPPDKAPDSSHSSVIVWGRKAAAEVAQAATKASASSDAAPLKEAATPLQSRQANPTTFTDTYSETKAKTQTELPALSDAELMREDSAEGAAAQARFLKTLDFGASRPAKATPIKGVIHGQAGVEGLRNLVAEGRLRLNSAPQEPAAYARDFPYVDAEEE